MMQIHPIFSTHGHGRKTHIGINGIAFCNAQNRWPWLLWDEAEFTPEMIDLVRRGVGDECVCKLCFRKAVAHLTPAANDQAAPDGNAGELSNSAQGKAASQAATPGV